MRPASPVRADPDRASASRGESITAVVAQELGEAFESAPLELAHAALAHAEFLADLGEVQTALEAQVNQPALAPCQAGQRLGHLLLQLRALGLLRRIRRVRVGNELCKGEPCF